MNFVSENIFLIAIAFVSGAMLVWPLVNRGLAGATVGTLQATRLINDQDAVIVDVRPSAEYAAGHLPNARNIAADELAKRAGDLPKGKPVIVVCGTGNRAGRAASALRAAGRQDVFCLEGGVSAWQQAGLPLVKK
ncbi:MAG: rhodanese-like domain-containing protein [Burkholderiaceae bacterium]|nr:rhodanese-like domain-containing protein [Burkholderiaceae bacterium]